MVQTSVKQNVITVIKCQFAYDWWCFGERVLLRERGPSVTLSPVDSEAFWLRSIFARCLCLRDVDSGVDQVPVWWSPMPPCSGSLCIFSLSPRSSQSITEAAWAGAGIIHITTLQIETGAGDWYGAVERQAFTPSSLPVSREIQLNSFGEGLISFSLLLLQ